jgi:peptidoglycan hydrolase-like protein with peptidoglycan-binding domain
METLAYLHLACANEELSEGLLYFPTAPLEVHHPSRWQKFSGTAATQLLSVLVGFIVLGVTQSAMAQLQQGAQGPEVSDLQSRLTAAGCYNGPIDGVFGSLTKAGVIQCQRASGLVEDGIAGPETLARLGSSGSASLPSTGGEQSATIYTSSYTSSNYTSSTLNGVLRRGSSGQAVSTLQSRLASLGYYRGVIDGEFGQGTEDALIQFQRDRNLTPDGIVGAQVYQALGITPSSPIGSRPSGRQLTLGDSGTDVEDLQRRLKDLGYFNSPVTGYYGSITQDAVTQFQQARGLSATGIADARTLNAAGVSTAVGGEYDPTERYVVIVPKNDITTLAQVQQIVPTAFLSKARLGDYVHAGAFLTLDAADAQSKLLRSRGLDARVAYQ